MPERILVVDDDDGFLYAVSKTLSDAGFEIEAAKDYRKALAVLEDQKPLSLLLTDVVVPGVNGFALARMARMRRLDLKVVYVTAFDIDLGEAMGPVLHKPVDAAEVLVQVRSTLSGGIAPQL